MAKKITYNDSSVLIGTSGADTLVSYGDNVTLDGGLGNDTYKLHDLFNPVVFDSGGVDTVVADSFNYGWDGFEAPAGIENIKLGHQTDWVDGNSLDNVIDASAAHYPNALGVHYLYGGAGNDTMIGSNFADNFYGGVGNDSISGGRGDDSLYGSQGTDNLNGGYGNDWLYGGTGNDSISGGDNVQNIHSWYGSSGGSDTVYGGAGNDTITGGNDVVTSDGYGSDLYAGSDFLGGDDGNDSILGGNDSLNAGSTYAEVMYGGEDTLDGGAGNDTLVGGNDVFVGGNDGIQGANENVYGSVDKFYGGDGNDVLTVGSTTINSNGGNDGIYGAYSNLFGDAGNDTLTGGNESINSGSGDDIIYGNGQDFGDGNSFDGGSGNDSITGGADTINAGSGNDHVFGAANDYSGDAGNDVIKGQTESIDGGTGDDKLYAGYASFDGGDGNDSITGDSFTIAGNTGQDSLYLNGRALGIFYGGDGNDSIAAGSLTVTGMEHVYGDYGNGVGYARLFGDSGNDSITGGAAGDYGDGGSGNDTVNGGAGNDFLYGGAGNDSLAGGDGDDTLCGGFGGDVDNDSLAGGAGNDAYYVSSYGGVDTITDSGGDDTAFVSGMRNFSAGANGIDNIIDNSWYGVTSTFTGSATDNYIYGGGGSDTLIGLTGNDALDGGYGGDRLVGGGGNDYYIVNEGGDVVVELAGEGTDTVFVNAFGYGRLMANVENMTLGYGAGSTTMLGNSLANVLIGNAYGNTIYGGDAADTLVSGGGADVLFGGAGNDLYMVEYGDDTVIELNGQGTDTVRSFGSFTLGLNVENLEITADWGVDAIGNALNNRITGGAGYDFIDGGAGNDTMIGGASSDWYIVDSLGDVITETAGGGTDDMAEVATAATAGGFTLAAEVENAMLDGGANLNLTGNVLDNHLYGNNGNNAIGGLAGNDSISGFGGNDTLTGDVGNDTLDGGLGADSLFGGDGNDVYLVNRGDGAGTAVIAGEDVVVDTAGTHDQVFSTVFSYTLPTGIEFLELDGQARHGTGNELNNMMYGNGWNNKLDGAAGNDTIFGGIGSDSLTGGTGNDVLWGGSGYGADSFSGGAGDDRFILENSYGTLADSGGIDTVVLYGNAVHFGFYGPAGDYDGVVLGDAFENLVLKGAAEYGVGNLGNNLLDATQAYGTYGGMYLYGGAGNDTLLGGQYGGAYGFNVMYGSGGNDSLRGGQDAINYLYGQAGNDTLIGGVYGDLLQGGAGNDSMAGGAGSDTYFINSLSDVVVENANGGTNDTIVIKSHTALSLTLGANVESGNAYGGFGYGSANHSIIGNGLDNNIWGNWGNNLLNGMAGNDYLFGNAGNDTMLGDVGNDTLYGSTGNDSMDGGADNDFLGGDSGNDTLVGGLGNDSLDGGAGNDSMTGGAGDDSYKVDSATDVVVEVAGGGTDTEFVGRSLAAITMANEVENLHVFYGGPSILATGNALANSIEVDNLVYGDHVNGAGGNDTLDAGLFYNSTSGYADLASVENATLEVGLYGNSHWNVHTGGNGVTGEDIHVSGFMDGNIISGYPTLTFSELDNNDRVSFEHFSNAYGDVVALNQAADTGADALHIGLLGDTQLILQTTLVEELDFQVRGNLNQLEVSNVDGAALNFNFSGTNTELDVFGLTTGAQDEILFQNFGAQSVALHLGTDAGLTDELWIGVDNAVIGGGAYGYGGGLFLDAGLESLHINTHGVGVGDSHGGSFLDGSGIGVNTNVYVYGGQDLTAVKLGGDLFDASGLSGDLDASWRNGSSTLFVAGSGNTTLELGDLNDAAFFGFNLDNADFVDGGAGFDVVNADFYGGTFDLHSFGVEQFTFTVYGDSTFNLGDMQGGSVGFGLYGGGNVTMQLANAGTAYTINAGGLSGSLTASTGSQGDTLVGTVNGDTLDGRGGDDTLTGGGGADHFQFNAGPGQGVDTLTDFVSGTDHIDLSLSQFGGIAATAAGPFDATTFASGGGFTQGQDANDHIIYDTNTGNLYYDADGAGGDGSVQIATLTGAPTLLGTDFTVIS